jgi:hypothetical protein
MEENDKRLLCQDLLDLTHPVFYITSWVSQAYWNHSAAGVGYSVERGEITNSKNNYQLIE